MRDCLRTCHCNETIHPLAAGGEEGEEGRRRETDQQADRQTNKTEEQPLFYGFLINFQVQHFFVPSTSYDKGLPAPVMTALILHQRVTYLHNNIKVASKTH